MSDKAYVNRTTYIFFGLIIMCTSPVTSKRQSYFVGVCDFKNGDGIGGGEKKIGSQKGEACIQACITYKKTKDARVNGVTVLQVCYLFRIRNYSTLDL